MKLEIGKVYLVEHDRKGSFLARVLRDSKGWAKVKVVNGKAHFMSVTNNLLGKGNVGDIFTVRKSLTLFKEVDEAEKTTKNRELKTPAEPARALTWAEGARAYNDVDLDGTEGEEEETDGLINKPKDEMCRCGHRKSLHGKGYLSLAAGHGACTICGCTKFTWTAYVE